jgi:hypothetical protein
LPLTCRPNHHCQTSPAGNTAIDTDASVSVHRPVGNKVNVNVSTYRGV